MKTLELTNPEYEQFLVDLENAVQEFEELSREVDWYATEMPERIRTLLEIVRRAT